MIAEGPWKAKACAIELGYTSKGNDQIGVDFVLLEGPDLGSHITWYGYFTEDTFERTIESLRTMGWGGSDLSELSRNVPQDEVRIVVEHEADQQGEYRAKVRWVNGMGGVAMKDRMDAGAQKAFAAKMKGRVLALGAKSGQRPTNNGQRPTGPTTTPGNEPAPASDDIPF